ncbi:MAG: hypothetical protein AABM43_03635 [Actinomycetota bacterium]
MIDRRRTSILALALLAGVLFAATVASAAQAVPPTRETEPPFNIDNSSLFCGFPLRVETLRNNVKITTFSDGRQLVTGSHTSRLTNLSSGKSLVLTDAGNVITNPEQTAESLTGRLVLFLFPGEPFGPGAWLFVGRAVATFAEPGGFLYSDLDLKGTRVDLCAALRG